MLSEENPWGSRVGFTSSMTRFGAFLLFFGKGNVLDGKGCTKIVGEGR